MDSVFNKHDYNIFSSIMIRAVYDLNTLNTNVIQWISLQQTWLQRVPLIMMYYVTLKMIRM
jgi:hypothetical protein